MHQHPECRDDQEYAEYVYDPTEVSYQRNAKKDHEGAENYGSQDTVEQDFMLVFPWNA